MSTSRRPWRTRVWFYGPQLHWWGWRTLLPLYRGGDEYDWHTIVLGWTVTGRVIIATRHCPATGRCAEDAAEHGLRDWPNGYYTNDKSPAASHED